jgi:adenosylcobinamide kinase / adenosylcobinamide-phosphate guanylyltransferase
MLRLLFDGKGEHVPHLLRTSAHRSRGRSASFWGGRRVILVTGGTRSGKSTTAERLAADFGGRVLYVATAEPGDEEMRLRIERHQAQRPADWGTLTAPRNAVALLREQEGKWDTVLFDCLTLYVTNLLLEQEADTPDPEVALLEDLAEVAEYLSANWAQSIVVTNEVGSGIVPADRLSRLFRDLQGRANQLFASKADEVLFCVSGIPVKVKGEGVAWPTA